MTDNYADDLKRLEDKLQPWRIRSTLAFAGLYQLTHELIKSNVLESVKGFFGHTAIGDREWWIGNGKAEYEQEVLRRVPRKAFDSSLSWLVEMQAITQVQADRLGDIYRHRHELTHDLVNYLVSLDVEPDMSLFVEALEILQSLSDFWLTIELDIGLLDEHPDVSPEDVTPLQLVMLQRCIDAYVEGLPNA